MGEITWTKPRFLGVFMKYQKIHREIEFFENRLKYHHVTSSVEREDLIKHFSKRKIEKFWFLKKLWRFQHMPLVISSCWLTGCTSTGNGGITSKPLGTFKYPPRNYSEQLKHVWLHRNVSLYDWKLLLSVFSKSTGRHHWLELFRIPSIRSGRGWS